MARAPDAPAHNRAGQEVVARTALPGTPLAPGAARRFVRGALADWTELALPGAEIIDDRLTDDAILVISELVTNAVVHAGTDVELLCRLETAGDGAPGPLVVEVSDHHPSRAVRDDSVERPYVTPEYGRGLRLVSALSDAWGITYRTGVKTVWARLPVDGSAVMEAGGVSGGQGVPAVEGVRGAEMILEADRNSPSGRNSGAGMISGAGKISDAGKVSDAGGGSGAGGGSDLGRIPDVGRGSGSGSSSGSGPGSSSGRGSDSRRIPGSGKGSDAGRIPGSGDGSDVGKVPESESIPDAGRISAVGRISGADRTSGADRISGVAEKIAAYAGEQAMERGMRVGEILAPEVLPPELRRNAQQDQDWLNRGALSFLAEASDLLAGQLDEDLVAALAGQLLVPRLADWCAVWLEDEATDCAGGLGFALGPRLARVWHGSENRIEELRRVLEKDPPLLPDAVRSRAVPVPWPGEALGGRGASGAALAYRLIAGGRPLGTLVIGRAGLVDFPDEITGLVEDLSRRIALSIGAARQYARQATISRVLQRGLLPGAVAEIPGVRSALVYEPLDKGGPSGDFYDLFPAGDGRWCFAVGDVQGKGPEAAVVIGLARPWLRLLAREGYQVADVLDRLNQLLLDDATEAADAAARALVAADGPGLGADLGPQTRFLSMLYGELVPFDGGVRCTLASAGHPLPLLLGPDGDVREVAGPQTLLGVFEDAGYSSETFELHAGDTLLCVTDGVTERRSGSRQFDDEDGLAKALEGCAGLSAELIAERIRRLVHEFGARPPEDDMALLVLQAE
ncbi:ATP-binding SpoIIE family protein phosphatase [Streptomyces albiflavescens]|nr:ATP-binding SpoIIE family protein phosphatase [Streptomyces albiflavescens]